MNENCVINRVEIEKGLVPEFSRMKLKRPMAIEEENGEGGKRIKTNEKGGGVLDMKEGKGKEGDVKR